MKRTLVPAAWRAGVFGLDTQSEQEGGELNVRDETKLSEVTWRQVICIGETLRGWDGYELHTDTHTDYISEWDTHTECDITAWLWHHYDIVNNKSEEPHSAELHVESWCFYVSFSIRVIQWHLSVHHWVHCKQEVIIVDSAAFILKVCLNGNR